MSDEPLLSVQNLSVTFQTAAEELCPVSDVFFDLHTGRTLGIVGESGCGKSLTALSLMRLVPPPGVVSQGSILFEGKDLCCLSETEMQNVRGDRISMIFQEPSTALNPAFPVGDQVAESLIIHRNTSRQEARAQAVDLLGAVGIPDPKERGRDYPHRLSGGMKQRVMIAMALACDPTLIIADEPTTALDVTVQAQILDLLLDIQAKRRMAMLFISHDLAVVSEIADDVMVMYAGRVVEKAPTTQLLKNPRHPYTRALIAALPEAAERGERLPTIAGAVAGALALDKGCRFAPRCPLAEDRCSQVVPALIDIVDGHEVACFAVKQEAGE